jgi:anti-sigma regulatory factor (Ser/Thr protein kinase)
MPSTVDAPGPLHPEGYRCASVTVPCRVESIRLAADFIVQAARSMEVPAASDSRFEGAIVEALNNALEHGNPARRPEASIACELERIGQRFTVRILDQGPGFVLPRAPLPEWSGDDLTTIPEGGFGISIIQGVFPMVRTIARPGEFGLEMTLTF